MLKRRSQSLLDHILINFDQGLRTLFAKPITQRPSPATKVPDTQLNSQQSRHAANMMRVNHAGEICAQALYLGQAITARNPEIRDQLQQAATEENDHLAWCEQRLHELQSHTSYLNPLWYGGSFAMGCIAGLLGDKWSLGFIAETERQVVNHIDKHIAELPQTDTKSQRILWQMREDEAQHAITAINAGAYELPTLVKFTMRCTAKVMTTLAYWI